MFKIRQTTEQTRTHSSGTDTREIVDDQIAVVKNRIEQFHPRAVFLDTGFGYHQLQKLHDVYGGLVKGVYAGRRSNSLIKETYSQLYSDMLSIDRTYLLDLLADDVIHKKKLSIYGDLKRDNLTWFVDAFVSQSLEYVQLSTGGTEKRWVKTSQDIPDDSMFALAISYLAFLRITGGLSLKDPGSPNNPDPTRVYTSQPRAGQFDQTDYYRDMNWYRPWR